MIVTSSALKLTCFHFKNSTRLDHRAPVSSAAMNTGIVWRRSAVWRALNNRCSSASDNTCSTAPFSAATWINCLPASVLKGWSKTHFLDSATPNIFRALHSSRSTVAMLTVFRRRALYFSRASSSILVISLSPKYSTNFFIEEWAAWTLLTPLIFEPSSL